MREVQPGDPITAEWANNLFDPMHNSSQAEGMMDEDGFHPVPPVETTSDEFRQCTCKLSAVLLTTAATCTVYTVKATHGDSPLEDSTDMAETLEDVDNLFDWDSDDDGFCLIELWPASYFDDATERWVLTYAPCAT